MSDSPTFEENLFAWLDALNSTMRGLDYRLQVLETKTTDTNQILEQVLEEIIESRREMSKHLASIEKAIQMNGCRFA
jgi:uncharacterized coiled-coil protein SlyX